MAFEGRRLAVGLAGFCAFQDLWAVQSMLPTLADQFHSSIRATNMTLTVTTLSVAVLSAFVGILADLFGRKRVIVWALFGLAVPTLLAATATDLPGLLVWRLLEGMFIPAIATATVGYIGDEWPAAQAGAVTAMYVGGSVLGSFTGRIVMSLVASRWNWQTGFVVLAGFNLAGGLAAAYWLPKGTHFARMVSLGATLRQMGRHLATPKLLATNSVGFGILFSQVATFTFIDYYLSRPPFSLGPEAQSFIFAVFLVGVVVTPFAGRLIDRLGRRGTMTLALLAGCGGLLLTLTPSLPLIIIGLAVSSSGVFITQASATSFIAIAAPVARATAVGLYMSSYYFGASVGAVAPSFIWESAGWPGCVAMVIAVQLVSIGIALRWWTPPGPVDMITLGTAAAE